MSKIEVTEVKEHENGDATYVFEMDDDSAKIATELGLKLLLYCSASGRSTQEVLDSLVQEAKNRQIEIEETLAGWYDMNTQGEESDEV